MDFGFTLASKTKVFHQPTRNCGIAWVGLTFQWTVLMPIGRPQEVVRNAFGRRGVGSGHAVSRVRESGRLSDESRRTTAGTAVSTAVGLRVLVVVVTVLLFTNRLGTTERVMTEAVVPDKRLFWRQNRHYTWLCVTALGCQVKSQEPWPVVNKSKTIELCEYRNVDGLRAIPRGQLVICCKK